MNPAHALTDITQQGNQSVDPAPDAGGYEEVNLRGQPEGHRVGAVARSTGAGYEDLHDRVSI
jgi:hypothetical protein